MCKSLILGNLLAILTLFFTVQAKAALVSVDWKATDDNLITRDTSSRLEWLDLTETNGLTYNYVSSQFGSGDTYEGFRYATYNETQQLFTNFRLPLENSITPRVNMLESIEQIISYMGDVMNEYDPAYNGVSGLVDSIPNSVSAHYRLGAYHRNDRSEDGLETLIDSGSHYVLDSNSAVYAGSYLVRVSTVPIPAAAWLFGSGLLGLIGLARRNANA